MRSGPSFTLVTTTINVPHLIEEYANDAVRHGRIVEQFIVAGDRKSPPETRAFCERVESDTGIRCRYLDVEDQERCLRSRPQLEQYLPWNSLARRNVALLAAWEGEAEIVVTIDDDNYLAEEDYFGGHAHLGVERELETATTPSGWWNVCEMLEEASGFPFYHRGFPLSRRWPTNGGTTFTSVRGRAVVNAGLWLKEPDIDAITRLTLPVEATGTADSFRRVVACALGTWSPFNSQNTALLREVLPAYFLFAHVGRYDDVWASYIFRHIADALGDYVTFGAPLVQQDRNPHDVFADLDLERLGMEYTEPLLDALAECRITARDYASAYAELAEMLPDRLRDACACRGKDVSAFDSVCEGMRVWSAALAA